jgi:GNAT superfamily N-acetyltransferase
MEQHHIEIRIVESYTAVDRLAISLGDSDPAQTASFGLVWQPKTQHVLVMKDDTPVTHIGFLLHVVTIEEHPIQVAGIGGVLTRPDCRGQGFGRVGIAAVESWVRQHRLAEFGMLFCREQMQTWYERLGWTRVASPVWISQSEGDRESPMPVMVKSFSRECWRPGPVRLGCFPW